MNKKPSINMKKKPSINLNKKPCINKKTQNEEKTPKEKNQYLFVLVDVMFFIVDVMLFILDLILDLIFILIFFIGPHIRKYLIFFFTVNFLILLFNMYSFYFGVFLDLDYLDYLLSFLDDFINIIRDISYHLDFIFVMLILYSIFAKDVTLFNYLFWFFILYLYITR